jgi:hypothetical protein
MTGTLAHYRIEPGGSWQWGEVLLMRTEPGEMGSTIGMGDNVKLLAQWANLNKKWQSAVFSRVFPALLRMRDNINKLVLT